MECSSILYSETIPLSLQSSIQFEMTTKKFVQLLYILLEIAKPSTILQKTTFVEEHDITVILEEEKLVVLLQISTSLLIDTERAIRQRGGITLFEEHRREKSEAIINRHAFGCTNRQVVRSSQFFRRCVECLRILQELSAVQTKIGVPSIRIIAVHREHKEDTCGNIHVIYDCNCNHGIYRCAFLRGYANIRFAKEKSGESNRKEMPCLISYISVRKGNGFRGIMCR